MGEWTGIVGTIVLLTGFILAGFGYVHGKFVTKEMFQLFANDVDEIKHDIKKILMRKS